MFKLITSQRRIYPCDPSSFLLSKKNVPPLKMMVLLLFVFIGINQSYAQIPSSYTRLSVNSLNLNRTGTKMTATQLSQFGPAFEGYRWENGDAVTQKWRPQGISGYNKSGKEWSLVSWYGRHITGTLFCNEDYRNRGDRVSFVDISDMDNIHYRHVLLVDENGDEFYDMHAGGLAVIGDTLFTVDSRGSIDAVYAFSLDSIIEIPSADQGNYFGYRYILPKLPGADSLPINPSFISYDFDDNNLTVGSFQNCPSNNCSTPENNKLIWFQPGAVNPTSNFYNGLFGKMQGLVTADNLDNSNKKDVWVSTSYGSSNNSRLYYFNHDFGANTMQNQTIDYGNNYGYISISPGLEDLHRNVNNEIWTLTEFSSSGTCGDGGSTIRSVIAYNRNTIRPPGSCDGDILAELNNESDTTICTIGATEYYLPEMNDVSYIEFNPGPSDGVWINADTLAIPLNGSSRSIFMWVKQDNPVNSETQTLFAVNTSSGGNVSLLNIRTNEKLAIFDGGVNHEGITTITDGNWHHVGYTYEQSTGETKLYVDGTVENTFINSQPVSATNLISFGQEYDSGLSKGNYSESRLTEISIWDDVLNAADIALFANNPIEATHPKISNLIAYYNANKSCGDNLTILNDVSGNGYDCQIDGLIGNHGIEALSVDSIETIPGFNSISYFDVNWLENGSSISTDDSLVLITGVSNSGNYSLELRRDPFVYTDNWTVQFQIITGTDVQTACESHTWIDGFTYTTSNNTATHVITNPMGCDSTVTLNLIINNSTTGTDLQTACETYTWIDGNTYSASNNSATFVLANAAGCDSTVTLDLTINNSNLGTDLQTACESYTWIDGNTYTISNNTATYVLANAAGCDSTVTLDLTINNSNLGTDLQTSCESYTWIDGNTYTISNNTATYVLTNAAGCDSTLTLDLTITNSSTGIDVQSACDIYTWIDGSTYSASNNSATFVLTNTAGCDSTVTLNLTINTVDNTVTTIEPTITANATGVAYQWIDCSDNSPIVGETDQSFTASANGSYAVELTENGCTNTSDCITIENIGILENSFETDVVVYPNPTFGKLQIDLGQTYSDISIDVTDSQGKIVKRKSFGITQIIDLTIEEPAGVYFLNIISESKKVIIRIIKK